MWELSLSSIAKCSSSWVIVVVVVVGVVWPFMHSFIQSEVR